jgi:hypothetical protein
MEREKEWRERRKGETGRKEVSHFFYQCRKDSPSAAFHRAPVPPTRNKLKM